MSRTAKRSVSLPTELSDPVDSGLATRRGFDAVRAWEREHGRLTAAELAEAESVLDRAGVGRQ